MTRLRSVAVRRISDVSLICSRVSLGIIEPDEMTHLDHKCAASLGQLVAGAHARQHGVVHGEMRRVGGHVRADLRQYDLASRCQQVAHR